MTKKADLVKNIVKKNVGEKPTFGTDPRDPWSTKANINEDALLNRYLKSRGINPSFVTKDQKVSHSKTNQFLVWKKAHFNDPVKESISQEHTPTEKRAHALKRALHVSKEVRTTDGHKQLHAEDAQLLDELKKSTLLRYSTKANKSSIEHGVKAARAMDHDDKETWAKHANKRDQRDLGIRKARARLTKEEADKKDTVTLDIPLLIRVLEFAREDMKTDIQLHKVVERLINIRDQGTLSMDDYETIVKEEFANLDEVSSELLQRYKEKAKVSAGEHEAKGEYGKSMKRWSGHMKATGKQIEKTTSSIKKALSKESLDPQAACNCASDGANNPDDTIPAKKSTAAKVKLLLGDKKTVKEELYDHEKEDKSTTPVGKKPKFQKPGVDAETKEAPQAAAVLSGGKTLTGEPRDTIEIDPMMKMRKQSPNSQKSI